MNSLKLRHLIWPSIDIEERIETIQLRSSWFTRQLGYIKTKYFHGDEPILEVKIKRHIVLTTYVRSKSPAGLWYLIPVTTNFRDTLSTEKYADVLLSKTSFTSAMKKFIQDANNIEKYIIFPSNLHEGQYNVFYKDENQLPTNQTPQL